MTEDRGAPPLRFEILGELRVLRGADPVDLGPAKQRAVLAVLLLQAGKPVPTHQIVDAVWGEEPPENGANVVQKYVAGLRRVLDPDRAPRTPGELLALTGSGYLLRTAEGVLDADEFHAAVARAAASRSAGALPEAAETLRDGLALWRGEALAGLAGPVFDSARARLAEARATAWEKWAEIELARGKDTTLIPDLARLVEQYPLREGLRAQLMIALHQGGRQAEALAAFRDAREHFLEEFGVEPGERMQETHRRILRGETFYAEPVDPWADTDPPVSAPTPPGFGAAPTSPPGFGAAPTSPPGFGAAPTSPSGFAPASSAPLAPWSAAPAPWTGPPAAEAWPAPRRGFPIGEVLFAALAPIVVCSFGSWIYFVYAGARRRDSRQFIAAATYAILFFLALISLAVDPSPIDSDDLSTAETLGLMMLTLIPLAASVHGAIVAAHSSGNGDSGLRERARQFAAFEPDRARLLGIGRPDLARPFDDGGLVDINHASGQALAQLPGVTTAQAHQIVLDRFDRGPYARPEDLVARGLLPDKLLRRIASRLICIRPGPMAPSGAAPGYGGEAR